MAAITTAAMPTQISQCVPNAPITISAIPPKIPISTTISIAGPDAPSMWRSVTRDAVTGGVVGAGSTSDMAAPSFGFAGGLAIETIIVISLL